MSEDPAADPNNPNLYSFGRNNPLRFIDPTGEVSLGDIGLGNPGGINYDPGIEIGGGSSGGTYSGTNWGSSSGGSSPKPPVLSDKDLEDLIKWQNRKFDNYLSDLNDKIRGGPSIGYSGSSSPFDSTKDMFDFIENVELSRTDPWNVNIINDQETKKINDFRNFLFKSPFEKRYKGKVVKTDEEIAIENALKFLEKTKWGKKHPEVVAKLWQLYREGRIKFNKSLLNFSNSVGGYNDNFNILYIHERYHNNPQQLVLTLAHEGIHAAEYEKDKSLLKANIFQTWMSAEVRAYYYEYELAYEIGCSDRMFTKKEITQMVRDLYGDRWNYVNDIKGKDPNYSFEK